MVENAPLNVHYSSVPSLECLVLDRKIKRMLLRIGLSHRCLLIIIDTLKLLHSLQVGCGKHLLNLTLLAFWETHFLKYRAQLFRSAKISFEDMCTDG